MSEPARGLVVAHASLAEGLVESARQIAGPRRARWSPSATRGWDPRGSRRGCARRWATLPGIVFTDMPSGSCAFAARRLSLDRRDVAIVCAVNLPMLLDFVFHRDLPLPELVDRLVEKGRGAIQGTHRDLAGHADRAVSG
jgi:mannose/fructose-specific phosphotransferase system component IIA